MSCHWDLHCLTCNEGLGVHWNHGDDELRTILAKREILADIGALSKKLGFGPLRSEGPNWNNEFDIGWFDTHRGHDIRLRSEYGDIDHRCNHYWYCECETRKLCVRKEGHEGEHSCKTKDTDT